jgi:hypothetical protein
VTDKTNTLYIYTLYDRPTDYPNNAVIRTYWIDNDGQTGWIDKPRLFSSVEQAKLWAEDLRLVFMPRHESDDPKIVCAYL